MKLLLTLFIILFASSCTLQDEANWFRKNDTNTSYKGIIVRKYLDPDLKVQPVFVLSDSEKYQFYNIFVYDIAQAGDSITKRAGTLKRTLKRNNKIIVFYPVCCDGMVIKDSTVKEDTTIFRPRFQ